MPHIVILSASVHTGRKSHRVALFLKRLIEKINLATIEIIDLKELLWYMEVKCRMEEKA
jgi:NAD(P)H-dependent FMN reductase